MKRVPCLTLLLDVLRDDRGQTMAEYGILAAVLGVSMIAGVAVLQSETGSILGANAAGWTGVAMNPP